MTKIAIYYGTNEGATELAAEKIGKTLQEAAGSAVEVKNIGSEELFDLELWDKLIIGCPTYNIGELQDDWFLAYDNMDALELNGRQVALFGLGDQFGYPDSFQDAVGIIGRKVRDCGAELVGFTDPAGFEFSTSAAMEDGKLMGLALDNDNQADMSDDRIVAWVAQIVKEFGIG